MDCLADDDTVTETCYKSDAWVAEASEQMDRDAAQLRAHLAGEHEKKVLDTAKGSVIECQMCRAMVHCMLPGGEGDAVRLLPF